MNFLHKPVLSGKQMILRPFTPDDLPFIKSCLADQEVIEFTGSSGAFDEEVVDQWYLTRNEQTDRIDLAIEEITSQTVVGEVVLNEYDEEHQSMNFRILIGSAGRNKGLGSEALTMMTNYMFRETHVKTLTLSVFAFNRRAVHLYEKAGFIATEIEDTELHGQAVQEIVMALTKEQWLEQTSEV